MAKKSFALNTEPHVAEIGDVELRFQPEVLGSEFIDAYAELKEAQRRSGLDADDLANADPAQLKQATLSVRQFLASLTLPESAAVLCNWDVEVDGVRLSSHPTPEEAEEVAAGTTGAVVRDTLRLPDRVLVELLEWTVELYGGGRPPMSSTASATASPPPGRRGTGVSPSRASTRTAGR